MRFFQTLLPSGTGAAPTTDENGNVNGVPLGLSLAGLHSIRVSLLPAQGQTLAADQQPIAYAWLFHSALKRWTRAQEYDLNLSGGGVISNGGAVHHEVLVDDASLLYFSPGPVTLDGSATNGDEQDLMVVRIEGVLRKQ